MKKAIVRGLLTLIRAFLVLVVIWQVITLVPALTWLQAPANITVGMMLALAIKVVIGAVAVAGYIGLSKLSNNLTEPAA